MLERNSWAGGSPSILLGTPGADGWENREPSEKKPMEKTSKVLYQQIWALTENLSWISYLGWGLCLATEKLVLSPMRVNANPWTTYLLPQREKWSRMVQAVAIA